MGYGQKVEEDDAEELDMVEQRGASNHKPIVRRGVLKTMSLSKSEMRWALLTYLSSCDGRSPF